ncbi:type I-E CRISPR-associated protein Cse2/CasB [Entomobacter blattae]|uniref:CRISPR-associated protein Cse2 n=1 Tax=Entomobacter blattae TaxID=2762277 RepID=A0A7H1NU63_9PROT|nr:type I-E CRISPR-associated protein Cse2/CasB [Entomobacter blattae]QNT79323.1 CRISPR-associated protein Cse2 [Entomobacter blattae]
MNGQSKKHSPDKKHSADIVKLAQSWWQVLQPDPERGKKGNKGALAQLRRCHSIPELLLEPFVQNLIQSYCQDSAVDNTILKNQILRLALVCGVLALVREKDTEKSVARRIGPEKGGDESTALCKPIRFSRLLRAESLEECLRGFRRLVKLMGNKVNIADLIEGVFYWPKSDECSQSQREYYNKRAEDIRIKWVFQYWDAGKLGEDDEPEGPTNEIEKE